MFDLASSSVLTTVVAVIAALIGLSLIVFIISKIIQSNSNSDTANAVNTPDSGYHSAQITIQDGIDDEVIAVIAAAIAAMTASTGKAYALRSVSRAREARPIWGQVGIQQNTMPF